VNEKYWYLLQVLGVRNTINYARDRISGQMDVVCGNKLEWAATQRDVNKAGGHLKSQMEAKQDNWISYLTVNSICMGRRQRVRIQ